MNYQNLLNEFNGNLQKIIVQITGELQLETFLQEMIDYQIKQGGKRFRPLLMIEVGKVFHCEPQLMNYLAATVEIIHNASLVHDDIQDYDAKRRGAIAAWKYFSRPQAINLGDVLMILALELIYKSTANEIDQLQLVKLVTRAIKELINGQVLDIEKKNSCYLTMDEYDKIIYGKTGSLFRLVFAIIADFAPTKARNEDLMQEEMLQLGTFVGRIFQIRDDIIDFTGKKEGRKIHQDIEHGRVSILKALAYKYASPETRDWFESISECNKRNPENIKKLVEIYKKLDVMRLATEIIQQEKTKINNLSLMKNNRELSKTIGGFFEFLDI
ncbi:MAG: polyprenyl synthetase family protein [Deltaproteobacteria bacterium]|jgi:octaprenyl-diphosphate synthase|nr:polyprenyl synthetase family protein [Deltaproteobacteria bacterium]